jgi:hypothetical protein
MLPVPGVWVVLHRVGSDTAGPIDSMRSRSDGRFQFRYRRTGSQRAIYFVSAIYDGIAYFSAPLRAPHVTGSDAELTVYDTTSGPLPLHVRGRHIVVSAPRADGTREIVEVYEIANDSSLTLISPDDARPTWSAPIPSDAADFQVGQGDISPSAIHQERGRVVVVAPFAPGLKQLSFAYRLPASAFPLSVPIVGGATVLEVLTEEPRAEVSGPRVKETSVASIEGRTFRRFLAQDVPANAVVRIRTPPVSTTTANQLYLAGIAVAIGAAMLIALAASFARRAHRATVAWPPRAASAQSVDQLARSIADLDSEFERNARPSASDREAYHARRVELKQRLARALDESRRRA